MLLSFLACATGDGLLERPFPGEGSEEYDPNVETGFVDDGDSAADTGAGGDSAGDTAGEVDTSPDTDSGSSTIYACYLGPARDHSVCLPVVAYSSGSFGSDYDYPDASSGGSTYVPPLRYLDISAHDEKLEIAPNFVLGEYLQSWKGRYGVMQSHVVDRLQQLRDTLGEPLSVNSGYRNPAYNASIGGAEWSRHMYGDAADLDSSGTSVEALGEECTALGADYVGLYEDGHTHCDWRYTDLDAAFYDDSLEGPPPAASSRSGQAWAPPSARLEHSEGAFSAPATGFDEGEPLRQWTAFDANGQLLAAFTGRRFAAPAGVVRVRVRVGGQVEAEWRAIDSQ